MKRKIKTYGLRVTAATYAKLERIMDISKYGSLVNTMAMMATDEIERIAADSRKSAAGGED